MPTTSAESEAATGGQPPALDEPRHRLSQLTTYELDAYLRQLERAVAFFERTQAPVLAFLRDRLAQARADIRLARVAQRRGAGSDRRDDARGGRGATLRSFPRR